jgi:hypothetical protein
MQLGKRGISPTISNRLRLLGSNPPSGKEARAGQFSIQISSRWLRVCMPVGKDLRFLHSQISIILRDEL